jgi:hypothetical protein
MYYPSGLIVAAQDVKFHSDNRGEILQFEKSQGGTNFPRLGCSGCRKRCRAEAGLSYARCV